MRERETDNTPRIRNSNSEVDQSATHNRVSEPTDSENIDPSEDIEASEPIVSSDPIDDIETNEDSVSTVIGLVVNAPVVTEPVVTEPVATVSTDVEPAITKPVTSELVEPEVIDPTVIDTQLEASPELQEGMTAAARVSTAITVANPTTSTETSTEIPAIIVEGESATSTEQLAYNAARATTENGNLTQVLDPVAADSPLNVITNAGAAPASNDEIDALLTGNVVQVDSNATDSTTDATANASLTVDPEAGELPTGSQPTSSTPTNSSAVNTVAASGATTWRDSGSLSDGTGNGGVQDDHGSESTGESVAGVDRAGQLEGATITRTQGADSLAGPNTPVSPIVTNQVAASSLSQVTLDPTTPIPSAEFRAPAPVATQMSAHLSTFKGLADGTYETTLRLYPEELGQVSVRIQVNGGTVSIHAYGASDIAVQALREAMPDLRQDLLRSGLDLVDSQVDQGAAFLGNDQESSSGRMVDSDNPERSVSQLNGEVAEPDIDALTNIGLTQGGRVDVRV
jgi:flagellar hook-length control protein FliK